MPSPGLLSKHYAPRAPLTLVPSSGALMRAAREGLAHGLRVGILATAEDARALREIPVVIAELGPEHNVERIASRLYGALRELDEQNVNVIFARDVVQHEGLWLAVRDRLHRAASR
jgi:L-threonylcarbamoyladenylate synthase